MPAAAQPALIQRLGSRSTAASPSGRVRRVSLPSMLGVASAPVPSSRLRWRSRAATTRSRTIADDSAAGSAVDQLRRGRRGRRWQTRSIRSSSGPLRRAAVAEPVDVVAACSLRAGRAHGTRVAGGHEHRPRRERERALAARDLREARPRAAGAGPRAPPARTRRSSSRNSTPRWASVISPGRGSDAAADEPRTAEIVWWGARNGRSATRRPSPSPADAVDAGDLERLVEARAAAGSPAAGARASSCRLPAARPSAGCGRRPPRSRARAGRRPGRVRRRGPARRRAPAACRRGRGCAGSGLHAPVEQVDEALERRHREHLEPLDQRGLARRSRPGRQALVARGGARRAPSPARRGRAGARRRARARRRPRSRRPRSAAPGRWPLSTAEREREVEARARLAHRARARDWP